MQAVNEYSFVKLLSSNDEKLIHNYTRAICDLDAFIIKTNYIFKILQDINIFLFYSNDSKISYTNTDNYNNQKKFKFTINQIKRQTINDLKFYFHQRFPLINNFKNIIHEDGLFDNLRQLIKENRITINDFKEFENHYSLININFYLSMFLDLINELNEMFKRKIVHLDIKLNNFVIINVKKLKRIGKKIKKIDRIKGCLIDYGNWDPEKKRLFNSKKICRTKDFFIEEELKDQDFENLSKIDVYSVGIFFQTVLKESLLFKNPAHESLVHSLNILISKMTTSKNERIDCFQLKKEFLKLYNPKDIPSNNFLNSYLNYDLEILKEKNEIIKASTNKMQYDVQINKEYFLLCLHYDFDSNKAQNWDLQMLSQLFLDFNVELICNDSMFKIIIEKKYIYYNKCLVFAKFNEKFGFYDDVILCYKNCIDWNIKEKNINGEFSAKSNLARYYAEQKNYHEVFEILKDLRLIKKHFRMEISHLNKIEFLRTKILILRSKKFTESEMIEILGQNKIDKIINNLNTLRKELKNEKLTSNPTLNLTEFKKELIEILYYIVYKKGTEHFGTYYPIVHIYKLRLIQYQVMNLSDKQKIDDGIEDYKKLLNCNNNGLIKYIESEIYYWIGAAYNLKAKYTEATINLDKCIEKTRNLRTYHPFLTRIAYLKSMIESKLATEKNLEIKAKSKESNIDEIIKNLEEEKNNHLQESLKILNDCYKHHLKIKYNSLTEDRYRIYLSLAIQNKEQKNFKEAIQYFRYAETFITKKLLQDNQLVGYYYLHLAGYYKDKEQNRKKTNRIYYKNMDNYNKAKNFYKKSLEYYILHGNEEFCLWNNALIAECTLELELFQEAWTLIQEPYDLYINQKKFGFNNEHYKIVLVNRVYKSLKDIIERNRNS